eukprot:1159273-Pelagomonas_calceolata.AAC.8
MHEPRPDAHNAAHAPVPQNNACYALLENDAGHMLQPATCDTRVHAVIYEMERHQQCRPHAAAYATRCTKMPSRVTIEDGKAPEHQQPGI